MNIDIDINSITKEDFKNHELVDIREQEELDNWPSLIACPHVPMSQFPNNKDFFDKNKSYLLFCAKGGRSHYLADILTKEGYKAASINNGISSVNAYLETNDVA